ncbi:amino acid adenylation domain-containing protein, partial [Microcystis sp. LE19-59.1C]
PEYMIPSAFVILESLPLTPNGKTDYRALPAPEFQSQEQYIAPRNPIEEILVTIWSEVLKVKQVSINHNFFELGGHSLLATQLISRIRTNFSIEIPLRSLFTAPTIEELSQQIQQLQQQDLTLSAPPILPRGEQSELLLSYAQTRLWFLDQLEPNSAFYNIPVALRLQGHLNQSALTQSLEEIIQRHEALRTNFITVNGQPNQVIQTVTNWAVSVIDLQHLSPKEQEIAAKKLVKEQAFKTFDLGKEALVRATLILLNNNEYWLLLCLHHVISDGWSMGVLIEELTALYNAVNQGQPSPLKPLPIQYADFAIWQRQWLQGEVLENQLNYWKKQLADAPTFLPLPTDKPRPAVQTFTGAHQEFQLSLELTQKLTELSQQQGVTMFMTLLAAYGILLYRYTGQSDILIGTPIANRNRREIESLIGFFVNTLVMRTDCSENPSFQELLMRVREMSLGAYAHQDLPFEMLVEALQPERNLSHTPLFQVMFALENTPLSKIELMDLTIDSLPLEGETAKFDLTLSMQNTETGLMGVWVYNTDLFNSETIEKMNGHFLTLLEGIITNPSERVSQLPLLTKVEQQQLLIDWNNTEVDYPANKCIHQLFEEQVERTPNAVAVTYENESLTYRELNNRANQLAHYLRKLGVKPDTLAGICVERSLEMMVGLLGILKAGGAYVPLDPEYPQERLSFMLEDSQVKVLVTQAKLVKSIPEHQAQLICLDTEWEKIAQNITSNPESVAKPENLIYIIYTSGSTGKPKGVLVNHSNVVRLFAATDAWYNFSSQDVWSLFHSYAFDFSVWEMWGALLYGGRLVVVPYLVTRSPEAFYQLLCQEKVTILNQTPTAFRQLIQAEESLKGSFPLSRGDRSSTTDNDLSLRLVIFGGEALEINSLQPWFQRHGDQCPQLVNMYGITETTVHVTYRPLSMNDLDSTASVIGRPIPDLQVYLLDQHLQLVPVGVPGEMYVGGAGVTKGYLNRPELTKERFISSPFEKDEVIPPTPLNKGGNEPSKLYKTGDLGRYLPDGNIEYLGRIDNQVKIRGFRIELGE